MQHDVFISYSSKNHEIAQLIFDKLENESVKCWMAPQSLNGGDEYEGVIDEAIRACKVFVLVFSEPAVNSRWVNSELTIAFSEYKHIIPFKIDQTILEGKMKVKLIQSHWIDAYPEASAKIAELVKSVQNILYTAEDKTVIKETDNSSQELSFVQQLDYEDALEFYKNREYEQAINKLLPLAIKGNRKSQELLCSTYYTISNPAEDGIVIRSISPSIKDKIEILANDSIDWANFILHCYAYKQNDNVISFEYVKKSLSSGAIGLSYVRLGTIYGWGLGVDVNTSHAMKCFLKAEELGCPESFSYIAGMYRWGYADSGPDENKAIEYYEKGVKHKKHKAIQGLLDMHIIANKYDEALSLLEKLADEELDQVELYYGDYYHSMYFYRSQQEEDKKQAYAFLKIAINKKYYSAYGYLSTLSYYGDEDKEQGREYAEEGYVHGDSSSYMWLAIFEREVGNYARAWDISLERFERFGVGADMLGQLFLEDGYLPDGFLIQTLAKYLEIDTMVGHISSCEHLIKLYSCEQYGLKDFDKEMRFRKLAADQAIISLPGDASKQAENEESAIIEYAQTLLKEGTQYYDPRAAVKYLKQAVARKNTKAAKLLLHQYDWKGTDYQKKQYMKVCSFVLDAGAYDRTTFEDLINCIIPENKIEEYYKFLEHAEEERLKSPQLWVNDFGLLRIYSKYLSGHIEKLWTLSEDHFFDVKAKIIEHLHCAPGCLSPIISGITELFPEYNKDKGIDDFIKDKHSLDSQLFYAQSVEIDGEWYVEEQDILISKLLEGIQNDKCAAELINQELCFIQDDWELWHRGGAMENFNSSYIEVCKAKGIQPIHDVSPFPYKKVFPFYRRADAVKYRQNALRALLSVILSDERLYPVLNIIGNSEELLNYAEKIDSDPVLQLFIISFVEVDIDVSNILCAGVDLLKAFAEDNLDALLKFVQECIKKIEESSITHNITPVTVMKLRHTLMPMRIRMCLGSIAWSTQNEK